MNKPLFPSDFEVAKPSASTAWITRGNNALWLVGLLWLECAALMVMHNWDRFGTLMFADPDDAMRLVQVRDFIAGQSWFDVSQHRVNPPTGGPMHWSRLLDMPIAGVILLLRPFVGQPMAEIIACVTVPLATLAAMCFALFQAVLRFLGVHRALLTVALLVTSFPILTQVAPLRIDHHGWQIVMAAVMLGGVLASRARTGGIIAGLAAAMWLHISSEGLPFAVAAGGVIGLRYVWREAEWPRLISYTGALTLGTVALALGIRGWTATTEFRCDGMTIAYIPEFLLLCATMAAGRRLVGGGTVARRIAVPAIAAAATGGLYAVASGPCLAGPFYTFDPVVYNFWYLGILEGLPFWKQEPVMAAIIILPGIVGLVGLTAAAIAEKDVDKRAQWLSIWGLAFCSFIMSCLMLRAMSVAHLYALIGNCWIIARLYPRVAANPSLIRRVFMTVALGVFSPAVLAIGASAISLVSGKPSVTEDEPVACSASAQIEGLNGLTHATIFAPVDLGPAILQRTPHAVIATSHHRNVEGLSLVIHAFLDKPEKARTIIDSTRANYLILCPSLNETQRYRRIAPDGLAARMLKGDIPGWLTPVKLDGVTSMQVYRISR